MSDIHVVVLAAGKGTRMKSARPKVLHGAAGLPLIDHVLRAASALSPRSTVIIIGHQAEQLKDALQSRTGLSFAVQEPQLGTGHALLQAEPHLKGASGTLVLLSGDVPLLRAASLAALVRTHEERGAAATVLTAVVPSPAGYGRIVRDGAGRIAAIVEHKDASPAEREIGEINSGVYAFDMGPLFAALREIGSSNAQGEYYLPDLVRIYRDRGLTVETVTLEDSREILGVNSRKELAEVAAILRAEKNEALMASGVTIVDPATTYIAPDVTVGADTVIHPGVHLEGRTQIGSGCEIHSGVRIVDSAVDDGVLINNFCVIVESHVSSGARIGPFAHIRPQSERRRGRARRQLRRAQEHLDGPGRESEPPVVSRRRDDRPEGERRRRHDHLQLRRHRQAPHGDRRRRVHRQRLAARRPGPRRRRRVRRGRLDDHPGRSARRPRDRTRHAGQQGRLGFEEQEEIVKGR